MEPQISYTEGNPLKVTAGMKAAFDRDGYISVRSLLTSSELAFLRKSLEGEESITQNSYSRDDGQGNTSRMCLWWHPGNDVTGMVSRSEKVAGTMEQLLGGSEVYHFHSKLIMKEAHTGGSFVWHQDYGYWYNFGFLFPAMATVFIAVDKCDKENGCLKVLKGSHHLGRIDHTKVGGQIGADMERVEQAMKVLPLEHVEMEPGDALFFHCNVLHNSAPNNSSRRRWAFLVAYNQLSNTPVDNNVYNPPHSKLVKVPDSAIMECNTPTDFSGKLFNSPKGV